MRKENIMRKEMKFILKWIWLVPLLIWIILTLLNPVVAITEPEPKIIDPTGTGFYVDKSPLKIDDPDYYDEVNTVIFGDDVGSLTWEDGKMRFEGDAEESAKIFFDYFLKPMVDGYIEERIN